MALSEEEWGRGLEGAANAKGGRHLVSKFQKRNYDGSILDAKLGVNLECAWST
jgi:hypothetical protein